MPQKSVRGEPNLLELETVQWCGPKKLKLCLILFTYICYMCVCVTNL